MKKPTLEKTISNCNVQCYFVVSHNQLSDILSVSF